MLHYKLVYIKQAGTFKNLAVSLTIALLPRVSDIHVIDHDW